MKRHLRSSAKHGKCGHVEQVRVPDGLPHPPISLMRQERVGKAMQTLVGVWSGLIGLLISVIRMTWSCTSWPYLQSFSRETPKSCLGQVDPFVRAGLEAGPLPGGIPVRGTCKLPH